MQNVTQQFPAPLSQKQETFSVLFIAFPKCAWNLGHSHKKDEYSSLIISEIVDAEWRGLLKRPKGVASEHHSTMNVITGSKHCWNQHGTTITLFSGEF